MAHLISQSCVRGRTRAWQDRQAHQCVELLVKAGVSPAAAAEPPGPHPLFEACYRQFPRTLLLLLDHGADPLNTRPDNVVHDDLYVIKQAFASFGQTDQCSRFPLVMESLLTPRVVERINQEDGSYNPVCQLFVDDNGRAVIKRNLSICIDKGIRVQEYWEDMLERAGLDLQWAMAQQAMSCKNAMDGQTARAPFIGARTSPRL